MGRGAAAAALVAASLAIGACGDDGGSKEPAEETPGVGQVRAGTVVPLAQCSDWVEGTEEARRATVVQIQGTLNEAGADGPTPSLPEDEAYELFERACSNEVAQGFRLYKIYARAAAFSRLPIDVEPSP